VGIPISFSSITITRQNLLVEDNFIQRGDEVSNDNKKG
jgi:hypothetical protein